MVLVEHGLYALVERTVTGLGYELVDVERAGGGLVRVTIERTGHTPSQSQWSEAGITVDDCERVSHQLTHLFMVEEVSYERLEVGSPGLDRPLRHIKEYERFMGALAKVSLKAPVDGLRKFTGRIVEVGPQVVVEVFSPEEVLELTQGKSALPRSPSKRTSKKIVPETRRRIGFALQDVEKARLVPELNFRSGHL